MSKVHHVIFNPFDLFQWDSTHTHLVGLNEAETQEMLAILRESRELRERGGGNPFYNPRYSELFERYHRAAILAAFQEPEGGGK
jgi:hypothetical protein